MFEKYKSSLLKRCICQSCQNEDKTVTSIAINNSVHVMCEECWEKLARFIKENKEC